MSKKKLPPNSELDAEAFSTIYNCNSCNPSMKNIFLRKATEEFDSECLEKSIFYQVQSSCMISQTHYFQQKNSYDLLSNSYFSSQNSPAFRTNALVEFAQKYLEANGESNANVSNANEVNFKIRKDPMKGYEDIMEFCEEMPNEWTIIHITKEFDPNTTMSLKSEILENPSSILLTVLKYSYDKRSKMVPLCFRLPSKDNEVYKKYINFSSTLRDKISFKLEDNKENRLKYWKQISSVDVEIQEIINCMKNFLGPFKYLFSGAFPQKDQQLKEKLQENVFQFITMNNLDNKTWNLLNLLLHQIDSITDSDLKTISSYLAKKEDSLSKKIYDFLKHTQCTNNLLEIEFLPCLLIIDENLDHFFWEMIKPEQEFYRISSFNILRKLYKKYQEQIKDGYITYPIQKGCCIINPDKTLTKMENRMKQFFNYWLPHWKLLISETPTSNTFMEYIQTGNCFVYCGHGTGLQFLKGLHIAKLQSESVVFLLGCESTKLKSNGLHSEMIGAHIYYHAALCPVIIGNLLPALDLSLDKLSTMLLSMWIRSQIPDRKHWLGLEKKDWEKGGDMSVVTANSCEDFYEPKLSKLCSIIRCDEQNSLLSRASFIYRGLPILNSQNK